MAIGPRSACSGMLEIMNLCKDTNGNPKTCHGSFDFTKTFADNSFVVLTSFRATIGKV